MDRITTTGCAKQLKELVACFLLQALSTMKHMVEVSTTMAFKM